MFYTSKEQSNKISFSGDFYEKIREKIQKNDMVFAMISDSFNNSIPYQIEIGISYAFRKRYKTNNHR